MKDLPQSKYDENGRPIKGKKLNNPNSKKSHNQENTFLGEQTTMNMEGYNTPKKLSLSQIGLMIIVFLPFLGLLLYSIFEEGFSMDILMDNIVIILAIPTIIFANIFSINKKRGDDAEVNLFSEENNGDLVDKVDEDLLEETDFDGEKADKIIEEFNR